MLCRNCSCSVACLFVIDRMQRCLFVIDRMLCCLLVINRVRRGLEHSRLFCKLCRNGGFKKGLIHAISLLHPWFPVASVMPPAQITKGRLLLFVIETFLVT